MFKVKFNKFIAMFLSVVIAVEFLSPSIRTFASNVSMDSNSYDNAAADISQSEATDEAIDEAKEKISQQSSESANNPPSIWKCPKCGAENDKNALFCKTCGKYK